MVPHEEISCHKNVTRDACRKTSASYRNLKTQITKTKARATKRESGLLREPTAPSIGRLLPGFGLLRELELLVASGLSPLQALRAATSTAAEALGKEDQLGTIERGKLADIVIVDADPLEGIQNLRKIDLVIEGGKTYKPETLFQQLRSQVNKKL